jgi:hypothetical protein
VPGADRSYVNLSNNTACFRTKKQQLSLYLTTRCIRLQSGQIRAIANIEAHAMATQDKDLPLRRPETAPVAPAISPHLDILLPRTKTAEALTAAGYKISPATLATRAVRGGGPPFRRWGRIPLYRWGDALEWAQAKLSPRVTSTAELDAVPPNGRRKRAPVDRAHAAN